MTGGDWRNVLVLQTSFLGDVVLTLPLLSEIKRRFPEARLTVLCSAAAKDLLTGHPAVDDLIVDDKRGADKGWMGLRRKAKALQERAFTMALTPHKSLRTALLLYFAGIPRRVGFNQSKGWFLFNRRVERNARRHDVERNLSLLEAFGIEPEACVRSLDLPLSPACEQSVAELLRSLGVRLDTLLVGVNPGSVWPTKRWSAEGFAQLIRLIKDRYDCEVLLFGGPDDRAITARINDLCGGAAVDLAGKFGLRELAAAVSLCRVFVTNDSAPMHIAVARKISTVAIFCATTPALGFYPYSSNAVVVEKELSCRPCASHGGRRCPLGTEDCIHLIKPERVFEAVRRWLDCEPAALSLGADPYGPEFLHA